MAGLSLKLIVGLGNPGGEYARARHNAGWWWVDELARRYRGSWRAQPREHTELARVALEGSELWLLKPTSHMNNSGTPTAAVARFHRISPSEILVVHDEIDLPPGIARLKSGGGHGGHNGVRDVMAHLGADFWRLRLGVGHPGSKDLVIGSVLDRPTAAEHQAIWDAISRSLDIVPDLLRSGAQKAMHTLHSANPKQSADS
ncbi:MAG TPA: aminoacyl-tRNA hydrolase [Steroidobacteraceae bacterium]|jgi:PTH1 family peptidyl-tRNA hydrolase|nr:aminoacyl-tRNA hydrolase [Steroidobacteraceae bacterium]